MADFKQAYDWAKEGKKVIWINDKGEIHHTRFDEDYEKLHWVKGDSSDGYLVTLNRNTKKGWEIYEDETKITVQEAIDQGLISKYCSCELCKNHPDNIHNKEKESNLSDEIRSVAGEGTHMISRDRVKECFKKIDKDIDREKYGLHDNRVGLISVVEIKEIIKKRAGPKLT